MVIALLVIALRPRHVKSSIMLLLCQFLLAYSVDLLYVLYFLAFFLSWLQVDMKEERIPM